MAIRRQKTPTSLNFQCKGTKKAEIFLIIRKNYYLCSTYSVNLT